jgi:hypothetical protein
MRTIQRLLVVALLVASGIALAPGAGAKGGDVIRTGVCSGAAHWKLKLSPDNGRIEVEFQVEHEQGRQGVARPDPAQRRADLRGKASHEGAERGVHRASSDEQPGGDGFVPRRSEGGRVRPDLRGACVDRLTASA